MDRIYLPLIIWHTRFVNLIARFVKIAKFDDFLAKTRSFCVSSARDFVGKIRADQNEEHHPRFYLNPFGSSLEQVLPPFGHHDLLQFYEN